MRSPFRPGPRSLSVACTAFAALALCATALASRPSLTGVWKGRYSGPYSGRFTLTWKQTGTRLSGSIKLSSPSGTYHISGSVNGGKIKFGAVGAGATYTGTWARSGMSGHYAVPGATGSWSAARSK